MENILNEIDEDVLDVVNTNFIYSNTKNVPSSDDADLTFERSDEKKGKILNSCVLYTDIRNSVKLTEKHHTQTMGRIYTAFTKSILKIAQYHNGYVRNIIGDRVMVVFPEKNCFNNAIDCAISINHISEKIINKRFPNVEFKCGIGIDYGELKVVKVGIEKKGTKRTDNKNLVWIGYPANLASRLTDVANKEVDNSKVRVHYYPYNFGHLFDSSSSGLLGLLGGNTGQGLYSSKLSIKEHNYEEFTKQISHSDTLVASYSGGKLHKIVKKENKRTYKPILLSKKVFDEFKKLNPDRKCIKNNYWKKIINHGIKNINSEIYEGELTWKID